MIAAGFKGQTESVTARPTSFRQITARLYFRRLLLATGASANQAEQPALMPALEAGWTAPITVRPRARPDRGHLTSTDSSQTTTRRPSMAQAAIFRLAIAC